jgi:hypothetical protein
MNNNQRTKRELFAMYAYILFIAYVFLLFLRLRIYSFCIFSLFCFLVINKAKDKNFFDLLLISFQMIVFLFLVAISLALSELAVNNGVMRGLLFTILLVDFTVFALVERQKSIDMALILLRVSFLYLLILFIGYFPPVSITFIIFSGLLNAVIFTSNMIHRTKYEISLAVDIQLFIVLPLIALTLRSK